MRSVRSTCCYCGTGCGVVINTEANRVVAVAGDTSHPSNRGLLCTKGSTLHLTMTDGALAGRAKFPEMRRSKEAQRERVTWDTALDYMATRFNETIEQHGRDAVAFYVSGQLLTEDYYVFNKLAKGLIGTANIDTNSRLCMSSAVTAYVKTLGADAPPNCYDDIDEAACLFIAGSNTALAHPVLFRRIEQARERHPDLRIIVVDPRRTETARFADLHLAIRPGSDVALFHAMLNVMSRENLVDDAYIEQHTEGFDALRDMAAEYTPELASQICGIDEQQIFTAARWFAGKEVSGERRPTLSLYCQGLNQSTRGTAKNASLINLHLATSQIGRSGAGPFSLTGQPNAMGGREVGGLATTLAAHRDLANERDRAELAKLWRVDSVPSRRGLTAIELFDALRSGKVKIVWIVCTNPAQSLPDLSTVQEALSAAELVILQDAYANTETAQFADVLLPATSWAEKEGTVTNSERRISRVRAAIPKPFEARHDWEIGCDFAHRLERLMENNRDNVRASLFDFTRPEQIWNEHRELTRGRDLDITGLSYAMLDDSGPQQWPFPADSASGTVRLYEDGTFPTASGRARFVAEHYKATSELPDARYPLELTTGRLRDQWHGMSRSGNVAALFGHVPEPRLSMSRSDMANRGLKDGELVELQSRRGRIHVVAQACDDLSIGQVYLPMHWGKRFLGGRASAGVNTVTQPACDPLSLQPELKHAAVRVSGVELPWRVVAFAEFDDVEVARVFDALTELQQHVTFASAVLIGRDRAGVLFRAAHDVAPEPAWLERLDALFTVATHEALCYDDSGRGDSRRVRVDGDRLIAARVMGDPNAITSGEWLREWLVSGRSVAEVRRQLLAPAIHAPSGFILTGRVVCQCYNVSEEEIRVALGQLEGYGRERLDALKRQLKCGTNCGSCLTELRKLIDKHQVSLARTECA